MIVLSPVNVVAGRDDPPAPVVQIGQRPGVRVTSEP
jgi:hypothetical protein